MAFPFPQCFQVEIFPWIFSFCRRQQAEAMCFLSKTEHALGGLNISRCFWGAFLRRLFILSLMSREHSFSHVEFSKAINNVIAIIKHLSHESERGVRDWSLFIVVFTEEVIQLSLETNRSLSLRGTIFALTKDESVYVIYFDFHRFHWEKGSETEGFILPYSRKVSIQVIE